MTMGPCCSPARGQVPVWEALEKVGGGRGLSSLLSAHQCQTLWWGHLMPCLSAPPAAPTAPSPQCSSAVLGPSARRGRRGRGSALANPELRQSTMSSSAVLYNPSLSVLEISSCSEGSRFTRFGNQVSRISLISSLNRGDQLSHRVCFIVAPNGRY